MGDSNTERRQHTYRILNSSYAIVADFASLDPSLDLDPHDFELLNDGKRYIQATSRIYLGPRQDWEDTEEVIIQEIDLIDGKVVFEWQSLPHSPPTQSCTGLKIPDYL